MKKRSLMLLAALVLLLLLPAGCGGQEAPAPTSVIPAPAEDAAEDAALPDDASVPADTAAPEEQPDARKPADAQPHEPVPEEAQPSEPESAPAEQEPASEPEPEPAPEPEPEPEPEKAVPEDGTYTANVTLEGGTGRATVESPAALHCKDGAFTAVIVWSSPNFDYMKVDGEKYELISEPGSNSVFEIPVAAFDQKLDVIADTVAMSEPHEVAYTLTFDSASLEKQ